LYFLQAIRFKDIDMSLTKVRNTVIQGAAANVKDFGAVGNSSANDTEAVQAAFNSGSGGIYIPDGTYLIDQITVPSTVQRIYGTGTLKQRATDSKLLVGSSLDGLIIDGVDFVGNYLAGQTSYSSDNEGLRFTSCDDIRIINCSFSNIQSATIRLIDCEYAIIANNKIELCGQGIYFRGCDNSTIQNNLIKDTILADSVFTIGISLESTDGHSYGICNNITVSGNIVLGYKNAQGIMGHSARNVSIVNNVVKDPAIGISINPFNATDVCSYISITGNTVECETTISGYSGANDGIVCHAGPGSPDITDVSISGNIVINANRATSAPNNQGGIRIGYTKRVQISGNTITGAKQSGIYLTDTEEAVSITGNTIANIIVESGEQNGIVVAAVSEGIISGNSFDTLNDASGVGIRFEASSGITVGENSFRDVTNNIIGNGEAANPSRTITSGTEANLNGVDEVIFNHSSPTTISTFIGVVIGKLYIGNTTINRTNAALDGGTNKTGSANDIMLVAGGSATSIRQAAPISTNS
jgi:parallel beta-helix repeat protein